MSHIGLFDRVSELYNLKRFMVWYSKFISIHTTLQHLNIWVSELSMTSYHCTRALRDSTPRLVRRSICRSDGRSHFTSLCFCSRWPHCFCPNALVTSNTVPAQPNATGVAVYPALFPTKQSLNMCAWQRPWIRDFASFWASRSFNIHARRRTAERSVERAALYAVWAKTAQSLKGHFYY